MPKVVVTAKCKDLRSLFFLAAVAVLASGCSGSSGLPSPSNPVTAARSQLAPRAEFLYVGGSVLSQYAIGGSKPLHSAPATLSPFGVLALDVHDRLVTGGVSGVTLFDAKSLRQLATGPGSYITSVTTDPRGYIYVANCGGAIEVLPPDAKTVLRSIKVFWSTCVVGFDRDRLYANDGAVLRVYALEKTPGRVRLLRTITKGITGASALAFGPSGEFYVANANGHGGQISVYARNASSPKLIITDGVDGPQALAVDSHGTLYVANDPPPAPRKGWVSVYAAGSSTPLRSIKRGIDTPYSLATDSSDNLYVLDYYAEDVTVYSQQGANRIQTIRDGLKFPISLIVGF